MNGFLLGPPSEQMPMQVSGAKREACLSDGHR